MDTAKQLGTEKIHKLLLRFSLPAIVGMLVSALYNIVDRIFVGQGVNEYALGGLSIAMTVMTMLMAFAMLISVGSNVLVSINLGKGDKEKADEYLGNAVTLSVGFAIIVSVLGYIFLPYILYPIGATENNYDYAYRYLAIIFIGAPFQALSMSMSNFIRSEGRPKMSMATMLIGAAINTILDPIFIFIFGWGVEGAALATIISQIASAVWTMYYYLNGKSFLKLQLKNLKVKVQNIKEIFAIGFAPFSLQFALAFVSLVMNNMLREYGGDMAISAYTVVGSFVMLILMPIFGINQGAQSIISYNYGAREMKRVMETLKLSVFYATAIMVVGFIAAQVYAPQIVKMFCGETESSKELIEIGSNALRVFTFCLPLNGFQIISVGYFQSVQRPVQSMLLSLSRQVLYLIPAMIILPKYFGLSGVYYAQPVADVLAFVTALVFFTLEFKKLKSVETIPLA